MHIGKTTLAHIVAQHCGYRPVEVNSSDDRSPDLFKKRIINALEMKSVVTKQMNKSTKSLFHNNNKNKKKKHKSKAKNKKKKSKSKSKITTTTTENSSSSER